jgi:hypothetical protein
MTSIKKFLQNKTIFVLAICLYLLGSTHQWAMQGHSIIAAIAQKRLKSEHPEVLEKIFKMLSGIQDHFPETKSSLLEAAAMPDLLNFQFSNFLMKDHFINLPILYPKDKETDVNIPTPLNDQNVVNALFRAVEIIQNSLDPQNKPTISRGFMDSLMTRYLLHLVGDIHQPLHNVAFFAKDLFGGTIRNGDQGGNLIPIIDIFHKGETNLHKIYDDAFNSFDYKTLNYPYSEELQNDIHMQADYLTSLYPEDYFGGKVENLDFNQWVQEGFDIAQEFIYSQVEMFPIMGPEYVIKGKRICQERMTLAGYRLYKLLKIIYGEKVRINGAAQKNEINESQDTLL